MSANAPWARHARVLPGDAARPQPAALWLLWGLVLAMLLAPALGRLHQVLHPPALLGAAAPAMGQADAAADAGKDCTDAPGHWLLALFAGHDHKDCLLLDQLSAWAGPPAAGPQLPAALPQEPPAQAGRRIVLAGSASSFDARAPPLALHG